MRSFSPRPRGVAAARGRLRRQTSSTTRFEVVCVGLPCIRPLGAATVATGVFKQGLAMNDPLLKTFKRFPLDIERAEGVFVFDVEGRKVLDFYAGHAVASTGHCHPRVVRAIQDQAARLIFYSNVAGLRLR